MWYLNTVFKKHTALTLLQFSQCDISSHTSAVLNVTWYRLEVLTLVRNRTAIWVRKTNSLVHGYELSG